MDESQHLPCGCINTIIWMHPMKDNKTHLEKDKLELQKNAKRCFEQLLKVTFSQK